ncbi:MAG: peptidase M61, partial [Neisseria subflava]|nr:peptidase M61 [Neisseria subflava]
MINYKITPNFLSHEWHITLSFTQTDDSETEISLPNWVPG